MPSGILQQPFFDASFRPAINFGSIGQFMGHEVAHGFFGLGQFYNINGNLRQWLKNETIQRFEIRAECFVRQYSNYAINGHPIDGKITLSKFLIEQCLELLLFIKTFIGTSNSCQILFLISR